MPDALVYILGFNLILYDRVGRGGGGLDVYVRTEATVKTLAFSSPKYNFQPEYLILSISRPQLPLLLLAAIYRPPKIGYLNLFHDDFERLYPSHRTAVIMGDFNFNLLR